MVLNFISFQGVEILSVAVGQKPSWLNIQKYVTKPTNIYNASTYNELNLRINDIVTNICEGALHVVSSFKKL